MSDPIPCDFPSSDRSSPSSGCDGLRAGVDGLAVADLGSVDDGDLGSELVELVRLQARLDSERVRRLAEFDARLGWSLDGSKSPAMWLARHTACPITHARAEVRLARRLRHLPVVVTAFARGELTAAKARLFADHAGDRRPKRREALVRDQELLVGAAVRLEHRQVEELLAFWVSRADPEGLEDDEEARYDRRGCHASMTIGQMLKLDGTWEGDGAAIILSALDAYADVLFRDDRPAYALHPDQVRTPAQRRADALVAICQTALADLELDDDLGETDGTDADCTCGHGDGLDNEVAGDDERAPEDLFAEDADEDANGDATEDEDDRDAESQRADDGDPFEPPTTPETDKDDSPETRDSIDDSTADDESVAAARPNREARRLHARRCRSCRARRHRTRPAARPSASVVVDLDVLQGRPGVAYLGDGCDQVISGAAARQMCCDAGIGRVVTRGRSQPLDVGRSTRVPTAAQRRALVIRDAGCALCGTHPRFCDSHHIVWWDHDGPTDLANLVLLCRHCHRLIHKRGWQVHHDPTRGRPAFTTPDGQPVAARAGPRDIANLLE